MLVVVTKIDMCRKFMIEKTISQLEKILKSPGCRKIPVRVSSEDDAITAAQNFDSERLVIRGQIGGVFHDYYYVRLLASP